MSGKNDVIDAERAARQVLARIDMPVPKSADGQIEAIRLIKIARDSAVKARPATMITLTATLWPRMWSCAPSWSHSATTGSSKPQPHSSPVRHPPIPTRRCSTRSARVLCAACRGLARSAIAWASGGWTGIERWPVLAQLRR